MKDQAKMLSVVAFLVLAIPMIAGAAPVGTFSSDLSSSQTFYGDGAVYGDGYLQAPPVNLSGDKCLQCHQGVPADFDPNVTIPDKRSYLRTGHGNMVKKVTSPPQVWKGAYGDPYPTTSVGHPINWATGKVDLGGFCDVGGFEGQFEKEACEETKACTLDASMHPAQYATEAACVAAKGIWKTGKWTAGTRLVDIIFLIGDWMSIDAPDTGISGPTLPPNKFMMADGRQYGTCGSCHTAGYKANDYTRPQPFADYPNFPKSADAGVSGSWVLDGIQCERCHDATKHYAAPYTATVPDNANSTALCSQCHIRPAAYEGSANPNAATQPTAYPIGASSTNFGSHLIGKQFLNSPHGKFTGPYKKIATTTAGYYNSRFSPDGTSQGGCDTCHDVHKTTIVKINPEGPDEGSPARLRGPKATEENAPSIRRECGVACHSEKGDLTTIRHPRGRGTPQGDGSDIGGACKTCHMPKPAGGTGLYVHVFRINTDPKYSTFPAPGATTPGICSDPTYTTKADCVAAGKAWSLVANSAPDGNWTPAVWVDIDLACGQCHGEGGEAKQLSKGVLANYAKGIHGPASRSSNTPPTAAMVAPPTVTGRTVTFTDSSTDAQDPQVDLIITVDWGDQTVSTGRAGNTFTHTYPGSKKLKKTITHAAKDREGLRGSEKVTVIIPKKVKTAQQ